MSDSGRDWGASSDESIRAFNAAKREAKIKNAIEQLDSLHAEASTVIVENRFAPESPRCMSAFVAEIYESWPTISNELKRLRAFEHAMHSGEKSIVGLQAEVDLLRDSLRELIDAPGSYSFNAAREKAKGLIFGN